MCKFLPQTAIGEHCFSALLTCFVRLLPNQQTFRFQKKNKTGGGDAKAKRKKCAEGWQTN